MGNMKDPIKVIHRYKNKNRRNQFLVYIFIGNLVPDEIKKILNKITKLTFIDSILKLSKKDHKLIAEYYGERWYRYFFPSAHIKYSIKNISSSASNRKSIVKMMGKEWFNIHIDKIQTKKKVSSFAENYVIKNIHLKKISTLVKKKDSDYRTYFDNDLIGGTNEDNDLIGGTNKDNDLIGGTNEDIEKKIKDETEEEVILTDDVLEEEVGDA